MFTFQHVRLVTNGHNDRFMLNFVMKTETVIIELRVKFILYLMRIRVLIR